MTPPLKPSAHGRHWLSYIAFFASIFVILTFFGSLHRSIDALSMLQPFAAIIILMTLYWIDRTYRNIELVLIALFALITSLAPFLPPLSSSKSDIRIYSKNLWASNQDTTAIAADIIASHVDVVMLQELSDQNRDILNQLSTRFPHQHLCRFSGWSGVAVLSRTKFHGTPKCSDSRAMAAAEITLQDQKVWIVSAHMPWPWPHDSAATDDAAIKLLAALNDPVVMAGDFNVVPWSTRMGKLQNVNNLAFARPSTATFWLKGLPLAIDHAMSPGGSMLERRPRLGSDHAGIVADLAL